MTEGVRVVLLLAAFVVATAAPVGAEDEAGSSFGDLLASVGLEREDLSREAPADGLGHFTGAGIPYLLPLVPELRRDPLSLAPFGVNLLTVAEGAAQAETPSLASLLAAFGLHPRLPTFRGGAMPPAPLEATGPGVWTAVLEAVRDRDRFDPWAPVAHGQPWPARLAPASPSRGERALPEPLRQPLAELLAAVGRAGEGVERSWRGLAPEVVARAVGTPDAPRLLAGGTVTWPALATAARYDADGPAAERGAALRDLAAALERTVPELTAALRALPAADRDAFAGRTFATPWGRVVIGSFGRDVHRCAGDCLLIVEPGGDDLYTGTAAAAVYPAQPVSVVVDLVGDDRYRSARGEPAQGAGLGGLGLLVDVGGADEYHGADAAQGFGLLGAGVLWDLAGDDIYTAAGGAQGAGLFGTGLLVDGDGGDAYRILGEGQGFGGSGGAGALVDLAGDDSYTAEPDPTMAIGRADYHADHRAAASNAQGAGVGRRGDRTDGDAWAGGFGVLADAAGDDVYTAGTFSQGLGYWWGLGMLLDAAGDDSYRAAYFAQGSGCHFAFGLLYDREGSDEHLLKSPAPLAEGFGAGASLGYGWDFAVGLLLDEAGDDLYRADKTALGVAHRRSFGLFVDAAGDDRYEIPAGRGAELSFGAVDGNPDGSQSGGPLRAAARSSQAGLFFDLGGDDVYPQRNGLGNRQRWATRRPSTRPDIGAGFDLEDPTVSLANRWGLVGWLLRDR